MGLERDTSPDAFARLASPRALSLLAAAAVFVAFVVANGAASRQDFPLDDAWIHQVYVRGLLRDGVPTYNPGVAESGFSSPAWIFALAPAHLARVLAPWSHVVAVKLLTLALAVWAAWSLSRIAEKLAPEGPSRRWAPMLAAVFAFASPGFAFSSVSGMEVSLTAAVASWTIASALDARWRLVAIGAALLPICRPEASLVVIVVALWSVARASSLAERARLAAMTLVPPAVTGAAWVAWNLHVAGRPLPNTFYAKHATGAVSTRVSYFVDQVLLLPGVASTALAAVCISMLVASAWRDVERRASMLLALAATVAPIAGIIAAHGLHRGVTFYEQRYFFPFTALDVALVAPGAAIVATHLASRVRSSLAPIIVGALCVLAAAPAWVDARDSYAHHCSDIATLHTRPALDARSMTPADMTLGVEGAGAARYFSERRVVDLLGLNDHTLVDVGDYTRMCRILAVESGLFLIPADWLSSFTPFYEARVLREYRVERWSVMSSHPARVVIAVAMRAKPDAIAWRARRLPRDCHARRSAP